MYSLFYVKILYSLAMTEYKKQYVSGLLTGLTNTIIFNPLDKAIFLSSTENRPLLHKVNWQSPYRGVCVGLVGRSISYGVYYPLIDTYSHFVNKTDIHSNIKPFAIGTSIGMTTSALTNPINLVKFHGWNSLENKKQFGVILKDIYKANGIKGLFHGLPATCQRDIVFSTMYTHFTPKIKNIYKDDVTKQMLGISTASCIFTIFSSPFNYVRNVKYHEIESHSDSSAKIIHNLLKETINQKTPTESIKFISKKLCLGIGSMRVGIGMAFGQLLYDKLVNVT